MRPGRPGSSRRSAGGGRRVAMSSSTSSSRGSGSSRSATTGACRAADVSPRGRRRRAQRPRCRSARHRGRLRAARCAVGGDRRGGSGSRLGRDDQRQPRRAPLLPASRVRDRRGQVRRGRSRTAELKPTIGRIGEHGIPIRDEIELVLDRDPHGDGGGRRAALPIERSASVASRRRRCSMAVQRSMTTARPPSAAIRAASQFTTPSWSHRQPAPTATASSAWGTHSSERRKTSTMSNGPGRRDRLDERPEGRHARARRARSG